MGAAKPSSTKTLKRQVNKSQPSEILKQQQKTRIRALLEEEKRQAQARKQFENFLKQYALSENHTRRRKTRRLRR